MCVLYIHTPNSLTDIHMVHRKWNPTSVSVVYLLRCIMVWYTYTGLSRSIHVMLLSPPLPTPCTQLWCCHHYPKVFSAWSLSLSLRPLHHGSITDLYCCAQLLLPPSQGHSIFAKHSWPWDLGKVVWSEAIQNTKNRVGGPGLLLPFWLPAFMSG